jgi:nuclear transcription Y subunit beta
VQECVSEFISFITSEASDKCQADRRKTINGDDIIFSMEALGFDAYLPGLKKFLEKFKDVHKAEPKPEEAKEEDNN